MKAAVLKGPGQIEIDQWPDEKPGPGEALVKIVTSGICGSDVHYYKDGRIGDTSVEYPFVNGHEPAGVVQEISENVSGLKPGDRVIIEPATPCYRCRACLTGHQNSCRQVKFLASPPVAGVFREYAVMDQRNLFKIPESMAFATAALMEPFTVGVHAVKIGKLAPGCTVGVFGAGAVGLSTMMVARAAGAAKVVVTDKIESRLEFARKAGADHVVNVNNQDPAEWIEKNIGLLDVAFEAAGDADAVCDAVYAIRPAGRVVVIGIPEGDDQPFPFHRARRMEAEVIFSRRSNHDLEAALDLFAAGRVPMLSEMATHTFPLEKIAEAFDLVDARADNVIRAIIEI